MKNAKILILMQILIVGSLFVSPALISRTQASSSGLVCLASDGSTSCPVTPPVLSFVNATLRQLRVAVVISNSTTLNTFDITLLTNHTILKPAGVDMTGSVLTGSTVNVECLGTAKIVGPTCLPTDTVDTLHLGASGSYTFQPTTGLLFTAIYNITGTTTHTTIGFQTGCTATSDLTYCVTINNGGTAPVPEGIQIASFQNNTGPSFTITATPSTVSIPQGSNGTSLITVSSLSGFTDFVFLTAQIAGPGPQTTFIFNPLLIPPNGPNSTTLIINTAGTSPGTYLFAVTGSSGTINVQIPVNVIVTSVPPPTSFSLSASLNNLPLPQGYSFGVYITAHSISGFSGTVDLTTSVIPSGPILTVNVSSLHVSSGGQNTTLLLVNIPSTVPLGNYNVTVSGTSGTLQAHTSFIVDVISTTVGDFTFSPSATSLVIGQGQTGNFTIASTSLNGFSGQIQVAWTNYTGTPENVYGSIYGPPFLSNGGTVTTFNLLKLPYNATAPGAFNITVTGTSGSLSHSFLLRVKVVPLPAFTLTSPLFGISVKTGSSNSTTITIKANSLFSGTIALSTQIGPPGPTATVSPSSVTLHADQTTTFTLTVSAGPQVPAGFYSLNVFGMNGNMTQSLYLNVRVIAVPFPHFTISANPGFQSVQAGANATFAITVNSVDGFTGTVYLNATITPSLFPLPSAQFVPSSVFLNANGTKTAVLVVSTSKNATIGFYTITAGAVAGTLVTTAPSVTLQVTPPPDEPPVAKFTFTPTTPVAGQFLSFDGSPSYDVDGSIFSYSWNFGDGTFSFGEFTSHAYNNPGNYQVTLTVMDSNGMSASNSTFINVIARPAHDVAIDQLNVYPDTVVSTQTVSIQAALSNFGSSNETVTLTVYANGHAVATQKGIFLQACTFNNFCFNRFYVNVNWDTTGFASGNYTISATVFLAPGEVDPTPADNSMIYGTLTVLPPPVITVSPSSGVIGTKVTVQGSGFLPLQQQYFNPPSIIYVNFDNMSVGFTFAHNGSFTFVFDIPFSQATGHLIFAFDPYSSAHASTPFTTQPTPTGSLAVSIDMGTIYFPGDTAVAYVLTTFNGVPIGPQNVQLQVILFKTDGTNITLVATSIGKGIYKATYTIPSTGPLGTYLVLAKAHQLGPTDASALVSFEVKLTWINSNSSKVAGAATVVGLAGLAAVVWKKGYIRRGSKDETESSSPF